MDNAVPFFEGNFEGTKYTDLGTERWDFTFIEFIQTRRVKQSMHRGQVAQPVPQSV